MEPIPVTELDNFLHLGPRRAVYDGLLAAIPLAKSRSLAHEYLQDALAVAGLGGQARHTISSYWPADDGRPLFAHPIEYVPQILGLVSTSPHERLRGLAVRVIPVVTRAEFTTWGFEDTVMPLPQRLVIAAKLGEQAPFGAMIDELRRLPDASARARFIASPPLTLDYMVGPEGPFLYLPCSGTGGRTMRITESELFSLLRIPFEMPAAQQNQQFKRILGGLTRDSGDVALMANTVEV